MSLVGEDYMYCQTSTPFPLQPSIDVACTVDVVTGRLHLVRALHVAPTKGSLTHSSLQYLLMAFDSGRAHHYPTVLL